MKIQLPKPMHGWRALFGEIGIIVVGVLLALGAQQIVEDWQARAEQRAFRETIDHEIGLNLFLYDVRSRQFACDKKRIDELVTWLRRARSGKPMPALIPVAPLTITPYRSAWDNRNAQVFNRLPVEVRQKYAEFYDELSNNWSTMEIERNEWNRLISYVEVGPISLTDRRAIRTAVANISVASNDLKGNLPISSKIAEGLRVRKVIPDNIPADWLGQFGECKTAIATWTETSKMNLVDYGSYAR